MPNWCYNSLTIEGSKELIADVKRILNRPFKQTHDSWNASSGKMELSDTIYSNPVFAFHNIYNHIQDGVPDEEYLKQSDFSKSTAEVLSFSGNNWYDWNVRNWGTKWDVAVRDNEEYPETELTDESETLLIYLRGPHLLRLSLNYHYNILTLTLNYLMKKKQVGVVFFNLRQVT